MFLHCGPAGQPDIVDVGGMGGPGARGADNYLYTPGVYAQSVVKMAVCTGRRNKKCDETCKDE